MKEKIKLWILRIEGWKYQHTGSVYKKGVISDTYLRANPPETRLALFTVDSAFKHQYRDFKTIIQTNLFWLVFTAVLGGLFALFSDNSTVIQNGIHWFNYASGICFLYPLGWTVCALCYMVWKNLVKLFNYIKTKLK